VEKLFLYVFLGLFLSGCAEAGDEVLSSLIYGFALVGMVLIGLILYPFIKIISVVSKTLNPEKIKKVKKKLRKRISYSDEEFVKKPFDSKEWDYQTWIDQVVQAESRIVHKKQDEKEKKKKLRLKRKK
jgi:hypothetical protein